MPDDREKSRKRAFPMEERIEIIKPLYHPLDYREPMNFSVHNGSIADLIQSNFQIDCMLSHFVISRCIGYN